MLQHLDANPLNRLTNKCLGNLLQRIYDDPVHLIILINFAQLQEIKFSNLEMSKEDSFKVRSSFSYVKNKGQL